MTLLISNIYYSNNTLNLILENYFNLLQGEGYFLKKIELMFFVFKWGEHNFLSEGGA